MEEYPSNTKLPKANPAQKPEKQERITTGQVVLKKKSLTSRFRDAFVSDDGRSVFVGVLRDVLVPAGKDMLADASQEAVSRALWGESRGTRRTSGGPMNYNGIAATLASRVNYSRPTQMAPDPRQAETRRQSTIPTRGRVEIQDIFLQTRIEADEVIAKLNHLIAQYGQATVADLFDLVGVTGEYTDERFGWVNMQGARPHKTRDGYLLDLPRPVQLD